MGLGPVGFDLDMTLIDSRPAIMAAFAAMSRDMSAPVDLDAVDSRLGVKLEDELAYWFPPERVAEAADCYRRHYIRLAAEKTSALPGAREALAAVRAAGERAVIITAKHPVSVGPSLRAAGLTADQLFTHVHGPEKAEVLRSAQGRGLRRRHPAGHDRGSLGWCARGRRHDRLVHRGGTAPSGCRAGARHP